MNRIFFLDIAPLVYTHKQVASKCSMAMKLGILEAGMIIALIGALNIGGNINADSRESADTSEVRSPQDHHNMIPARYPERFCGVEV
jgi:hypothetical protein